MTLRRFVLLVTVGILTFLIGVTAAAVLGAFNPFARSRRTEPAASPVILTTHERQTCPAQEDVWTQVKRSETEVRTIIVHKRKGKGEVWTLQVPAQKEQNNR